MFVVTIVIHTRDVVVVQLSTHQHTHWCKVFDKFNQQVECCDYTVTQISKPIASYLLLYKVLKVHLLMITYNVVEKTPPFDHVWVYTDDSMARINTTSIYR